MSELRYLYFPGCKMEPLLPEYDRATRAVMARLDIALDNTEINCCGYPVRDIDFTAAMVSGARILAMAAQKKIAVMTPCKCCYGNLKWADFWMRQNKELRDRVNGLLKADGLQWSEGIIVHHLLTVLSQDATLERLKKRITHPLNGIRLAAHYGCHALRPGDVTRFDNPLAPTIFEKVIEAAGAVAVQWPLRLECCGQPLWDKNRNLSLALMTRKLADALESGAQALITACTYCQLQFDKAHDDQFRAKADCPELPSILISQLLGIAMGLSIDQQSL